MSQKEFKLYDYQQPLNNLEVEVGINLNPDNFQRTDGVKPILNPKKIKIDNIQEGIQLTQFFIKTYNLGSGDWGGGYLYLGGVNIGYISYNGKVWENL